MTRLHLIKRMNYRGDYSVGLNCLTNKSDTRRQGNTDPLDCQVKSQFIHVISASLKIVASSLPTIPRSAARTMKFSLGFGARSSASILCFIVDSSAASGLLASSKGEPKRVRIQPNLIFRI